MDLDKLIMDIQSLIDPTWDTLHIIRFVYLYVGKKLKKNTDFFFSVDGKLEDFNLTFEEIRDAYNNDLITDNAVICKSSSLILLKVFNALGIKSTLVKSLNNVIDFSDGDSHLDIHHWFLAVNDGTDTYFCTLSSDLPYIQTGMETHHFGTSIPYKKNIDGKEIQVYEGNEIEYKVIDKSLLRKIDTDIGYIRTQYNYDSNYKRIKGYEYNYNDASLYLLSEYMKGNKAYEIAEVESTYFYEKLVNFKRDDGHKESIFGENGPNLTDSEWDRWIKTLCSEVIDKINHLIFETKLDYYKINLDVDMDDPNWDYDSWLKTLCSMLQRYFAEAIGEYPEDLYIEEDFDFSGWIKKLKKLVGKGYSSLKYDSVISVLDQMNTLVIGVRNRKFDKNFAMTLKFLGYHFVRMSNLYETSTKDGKVSSKYIAHKFKKLFKIVFGCNEMRTDLNDMDYSEQIVIIKMVLSKMFGELTPDNARFDDSYNDKYPPVFNRIHIYPVRNKKTGDYAIVFRILDDGTYTDMYYFYELKSNKFRLANMLDIYYNYTIVSERLKSYFEKLENIEEIKKIKM